MKPAKLLDAQGIEAEVCVAPTGAPDRVVADIVKLEDLDLVVIGRPHDEGALGRLSTHPYDIVRHSPCP